VDDKVWCCEICGLYKDMKFSEFIKFRRLQWAERVIRMEENRLPQKEQQQTIHCKTQIGKPRKRREDGVRDNAVVLLGIGAWKTKTVEAKHRGGQGSMWAVKPLQQRLATVLISPKDNLLCTDYRTVL
jgi:hypothetical protein